MKHIYTSLFALVILFCISIPLKINAQCTCSGGAPATPITYLDTVLPTQASTTIFNFPQFDPSIGTLSCILFNDTVSVVVTTAARNTDTTVGHNYIFQTTITNAVNGPSNSGPMNWLATFVVDNQSYGPVYLDTDKIDLHPPQPRLPDDSTTFGPDTLINKVIGAGSPPNITPFLGTGTVNFSTNLTGGASALLGGVNYVTGIKSNSWGAFRLTYYWCPTIVLAENIINFTAAKNGSMVQLQWLTENEQSGFTYEIEYSRNASSYTPVGYLQSAGEDPDVNSKYQYFYAINSSDPEKIYFRVKRTGPDGKSTYTTIKSVTLNGSVSAGMQVYPNPVKGSVTFEFDQVQNGNFSIQLVNTAGQVIQQNAVTVTGSTQIRLNLTCNPARGLYFLYTKDLTHNQQYITKVLVN